MPSWDTYQKMSALCTSIKYLEQCAVYNATELDEIINELVDNLGEHRTLEIIKSVLNEFKKDLDCVSPHLSVCLLKKIKESI